MGFWEELLGNGRPLPDFENDRYFAVGGEKFVYKVHWRDFGDVVIKVPRNDRGNEEIYEEFFREEVELALFQRI